MYKSAARFRCPSLRISVGGEPVELNKSGGKALNISGPSNHARKNNNEKKARKIQAINELKKHIGKKVEGVVVRIKDFGAFVELKGGVIGLVHISNISNKRVVVAEELKIGETVVPTIVDISKETGEYRISLSLRNDYPANIYAQKKAKTPLKELTTV